MPKFEAHVTVQISCRVPVEAATHEAACAMVEDMEVPDLLDFAEDEDVDLDFCDEITVTHHSRAKV